MSVTKIWGDNDTDDYIGRAIDCYIDGSQIWNNFNGPQLQVGQFGLPTSKNRSFLSFAIKADLEALGAVSIASAKLYLWVTGITGALNVGAYRCLQDWVENQNCWFEWRMMNPWHSGGCSAADDSGVDDDPVWDRHATALDTQPPSLPPGYTLILDITTLAQLWFSGAVKEYGVILISDNEVPNNWVNSIARENVTGMRPYLEIEFNLETYQLIGNVRQLGIEVQRIVRCYNRATGVLFDSTTSDPDGTFVLNAPDDTTELYIIAIDDDAGEQYNALIYDRVKGVLQP